MEERYEKILTIIVILVCGLLMSSCIGKNKCIGKVGTTYYCDDYYGPFYMVTFYADGHGSATLRGSSSAYNFEFMYKLDKNKITFPSIELGIIEGEFIKDDDKNIILKIKSYEYKKFETK